MSIIKVWYVERMKFLFDIIVHKKTKKKSKVNVTKFKTGPFLSFTSFWFCKDYFHSYIYQEDSAKFYSKFPCMFLAFSRNS